MKKEVNCPKCNSNKIKRNGRRVTRNRGKIQRYKCKKCSYRFTKDNGFYRMRNSPQKITLCLDLFFKGISTRQIQAHLKSFYPNNSSQMSVYRWVLKYSKMISNFTDKLPIRVRHEVQVDEMEYATKGKQSWFIDSIDTYSRFMISSSFVKSRGLPELKQIMKNIDNKAKDQWFTVTTDGFLAYPKAVKKAFTFNKLNRGQITHKIVNASKGKGFNLFSERLHNSIRQRTKTFRGFHSSIDSANAIMKGFETYYNFITKHQAINKCPYELTIPQLELNGKNKWLELIRLSKKEDFQ